MSEDNKVEIKKAHERYGASVAIEALSSMKNEKKRKDEVSSDAKAFIEECEAAGENPISAVKFVAGKKGIELSGERPEGENGKMYDLLREVVDEVVEKIFMEEEDDDEFEEESEMDDELDPTVLVAKNRPARKCRGVFGYAFTW